jgi:hypothetical protein
MYFGHVPLLISIPKLFRIESVRSNIHQMICAGLLVICAGLPGKSVRSNIDLADQDQIRTKKNF